jgi:hypothetical protein
VCPFAAASCSGAQRRLTSHSTVASREPPSSLNALTACVANCTSWPQCTVATLLLCDIRVKSRRLLRRVALLSTSVTAWRSWLMLCSTALRLMSLNCVWLMITMMISMITMMMMMMMLLRLLLLLCGCLSTSVVALPRLLSRLQMRMSATVKVLFNVCYRVLLLCHLL